MDTDTLNTYIAELSEKTNEVQEMKDLSENDLVQRLNELENNVFEEVRNNYEGQDGPLKTSWYDLADNLENNENLDEEQIKDLLNGREITFENLWPFFLTDKENVKTKFEHVCDCITKEVKLDKYKQEKTVLYKNTVIPKIYNVWTSKDNNDNALFIRFENGTLSVGIWDNAKMEDKYCETIQIQENGNMMGQIIENLKNYKKEVDELNSTIENSQAEDSDKTTKQQKNNGSGSDIPLNQILYGAPGTGKTYNTVIKALEIITGKTYKLSNDLQERKEQYKEYLAEFNKLKDQGQIEFVTFHPSTSYEEFVEGIKPVMQESEEQSDLQYKIEDGIFKRIAKRAGAETISLHGESIDFTKTRIFKMSLGQGTDNDIFKYCMENNVIANGYGNGIDFSGVKNKQDIIKKVKSDNKYDFSVEAMKRFILWMKPGDIVLIADGKSSVAAIAQVKGKYEYKTDTEIDYTNFRKVKWLYKGDIPIKAIYNKNLSMQSIYAFYNESKKGTSEYNTNINTEYLNKLISGKESSNKDKKYVLIIDEINRGNISKIFGELITLLEPTKRIGADETLYVTLPYSKKPFGVPANLYIIGTMNTSDRSIASLDIALRRRFSFRAMRPEDNLVKDVKDIQLNSIFKKMNKKIEILLDEDHMIGHSFLMKCQSVEDVRKAWFNEIMPLINEYFYGDWEKIKMVLGDFVVPIDDIPKDIKEYCNGETFYKFIEDNPDNPDNLGDKKFVEMVNKLA